MKRASPTPADPGHVDLLEAQRAQAQALSTAVPFNVVKPCVAIDDKLRGMPEKFADHEAQATLFDDNQTAAEQAEQAERAAAALAR